jgi:hypothetical protein
LLSHYKLLIFSSLSFACFEMGRLSFSQVSPSSVSKWADWLSVLQATSHLPTPSRLQCRWKKSCKGNIVEAKLNNRSRWAMPKVLQRQHHDAQVAHKCVPGLFRMGESVYLLYFHIYICTLARFSRADLATYSHDIFYIKFHFFCCSTMLLS